MQQAAIHHIETDPEVMGGKPHITGHRISVQQIAFWHERMGLDVEEIATTYNLSLAEVYSALAYYHDHREEIDTSIRADEAFADEMRRTAPSRLREKLGG